ncbi:hypothetical protein OCL06_13650 [Alteromonas sp. ASW11-19]|uniref:PcRGLX/YetA-like N-terminal RIFT barrel domain-containing protein n=1 Tax=Alteromonas salexigens TaxID=2982530 RepID=A0ABT2VQQ0_9ALTE|nr:hypothetical protein [Alteromonas salexigens]MCU7555635.1 hypothetical protein [Alteromonas salexigens]
MQSYGAAFTISNSQPTAITACAVSIGLPLPRSRVLAQDPLAVYDADGVPVSTLACQPTAFWPDNSVKWIRVIGTLDLPADSELTLFADKASVNTNCKQNAPLVEKSDCLTVSVPDGEMHFSYEQPLVSFPDGSQWTGVSAALAEKDQPVQATCCHFSHRMISGPDGPVVLQITQSLTFPGSPLRAQCTQELFLDSGDLHSQVSITNPEAARHEDGKWDLGDPNSQYLHELNCRISASQHPVLLIDGKELQSDAMSLHQASSGHPNWQSRNHVTKDNQVNLPFRGFQVTTSDGEVLHHGDQASPVLQVSGRLCMAIRHFWQNFPASINTTQNSAEVSLLGSAAGPETELQPGEQKTRTLIFSSSTARLTNPPPVITVLPEPVALTQAIPFFATEACQNALHGLIQAGLTGDNNFFEKRLAIDEFGWRHFGELYADHEKALTPDKSEFISHYNNQYDPIYGMLLQWLLTGNPQWFELADDLARHVADIDVYHTEQDKPEYSGGMFWHTDHYVEAFTATHRTYSKRQPSDVYEDHAGGGGPGGQHCYTSGLLLHFLLTGSDASRDAFLRLCSWIEHVYEGDGTLFGALLAMRKSKSADSKDIISGQYPFDRGTGNYLQAMLDRYALLNHKRDLQRATFIVQHTVSPADCIASRNLDDKENTWFYTVFLQALCRYITTLEQESKVDKRAYRYAVDSLLHYAGWMAEHETLTLEHAQSLEFPNETWTAQDLRKLNILAFAQAYAPAVLSESLANKCETLLQQINHRLQASPEAATTRVLCLMMQNYNDAGYALAPRPLEVKQATGSKAPAFTLMPYLFTTLRSFSLKGEVAQLQKRFAALRKLA